MIIVGIGEFAKEVQWLVEQINKKKFTWQIEGYLYDSAEIGMKWNGYPVLGSLDKLKEYGTDEVVIVCAILNAQERKRVIEKIKALGKFCFPNLIDPQTQIPSTVEMGDGNLILSGSQLSPDAIIDDFVIVHRNCTVASGVRLHSYVTLRTGGNVLEKVEIESEVEINAGSVVAANVASQCVVMGRPAHIVKVFGKYEKLLILGANGHGKAVMELANQIGCYTDILFLDDDPLIQKNDLVVGNKMFAIEHKEEYDVIIAIGNAVVRKKIQEEYEKAGVNIVTLVSIFSNIAQSVKIGPGCVIMAGTVIQPETYIGKGVIVNTGASVDHGNEIGDFVHIAVGAHLAGNVKAGIGTWIGAGAIVSNNIDIGENIVVGAGAVVVKDLKEAATYIGVPAKKMK